MIALGALDAQIRAQIVRKAIMTVERDRGIAMRFGLVQCSGHSLGCRQIEQILRHIGTGGDRAQKKLLCFLVQSKQAEDRTECVLRFGRVVDHLGSRLGGLERLSCLAGNEQAFCAQHERNRIFRHEGDGAIGAEQRRIQPTTLQRGFRQQRPGGSIVRSAGEHL